VDVFTSVQQKAKGPGCDGWWVSVIPQLTDDQRSQLEQAAADRRITHRTIAVVLTQWGFEVTPTQVGHWRRNRG
jgi:hypothetical protein